MDNILLVDGYAFLFRAYYASPNLISPAGVPIGGVSGFIQMMFKLIESHNVTRIAVILDSGGSKNSIRHKMYPAYKAHRPPIPTDLLVQFTVMREALDAFGIRYVEHDGTEADDIIASYAKLARESHHNIKIVSSDKDLFQLIDHEHGITLYDPVKDLDVTNEVVQNKLGVSPSQIADYLGLVGDTADNIPGVKGIGPKTAATLLQQYHCIENIYKHVDEIKPERIRNLLQSYADSASTSKTLATLMCDLPLFYKLDEFAWNGLLPNSNGIQTFLNKYSLKTLAARYLNKIVGQQISHIQQENSDPVTTTQDNVETYYHSNSKSMITQSEWDKILEHMRYFGTVSLHFQMAEDNSTIQSISIFCHDMFVTVESCDILLKDVVTASNLKKCFESKTIHKIVFALKDILHALARYNITIVNVDDIKLLAYTAGSGKYKHQYDINNIRNEYLQNYDDNNSYTRLEQHTPCLANTIVYSRLYHILLKKLHSQQQLTLYYTIDKPLNSVLFTMERSGIAVNVQFLHQLRDEYSKIIKSLESQIYDFTGIQFNINSPKQTSNILFEHLKLPILTNSKKLSDGQYSTSNEVLEELSAQGFSITDQLLEWRRYSKILNTFINCLLENADSRTHRIHTNFNATLTHSGRLSSSSPNLQNIPIRTEEGRKIRDAFVAANSKKFVSADYSQIEIRLLAHIAEIKELQDMLKYGADVHAITASQVFGIPLSKMDEVWRRRAKAVNFGIIYGISSYGLAKNLQIPIAMASGYIDSYFKRYHGIKEYMASTISMAKSNGYVSTLFGRRCFIPNINSSNNFMRKFSERSAINAPLQGSAADIIRKAMVKLPQELRDCLQLQIHDELLFEIPECMVEEACKVIRQVMESAASLSVPLPVEIKVGNSWGKMT